MEQALHDVPLFREFAGLGGWAQPLPDETTILASCHKLEEKRYAPQILATVNAVLQAKGRMLREGTVVDATLIAAPSSTKNANGERDPEMKQIAKGMNRYFGTALDKPLRRLIARSHRLHVVYKAGPCRFVTVHHPDETISIEAGPVT